MEKSEYLNVDVIMKQYEILIRQIIISKISVLFELFGGTLLLILWISSSDFLKMPYSLSGRTFFIMPTIINAVIWLIWGGEIITRRFQGIRQSRKETSSDSTSLIRNYESSKYEYFLQKRLELYLNILTAFQFLFIAIFWVYLTLYF